MRTVVINLKRSPDRLAAFRSRWHAGIWPHRIEWAPGVAADSPIHGCTLAHRALWAQLAADPRAGDLLVLEDDADPLRPLQLPQLPGDADMLLLGGEHIGQPAPAGDGLMLCRGTHRTHAYLLRPHAAATLLELTEHLPEDQYVSVPLARAQYTGELTVYAADPWQVGQCAGRSEITGVLESGRSWQRA